jgi:hypothetical protein
MKCQYTIYSEVGTQFSVFDIFVLQILCISLRARLHTFQRFLHRPTSSHHRRLFFSHCVLFAGIFWILQSVPISQWKKSDLNPLCHLGTCFIWLGGDIFGNIADMFGRRSFVKLILMMSYVISFISMLVATVIRWKQMGFLRGIAFLTKANPSFLLLLFEIRFWRWKKLTDGLIEQLPMTTMEDIEKDSICIICRGEMTVEDSQKINCGHCFHSNCLTSWLKRQMICPTCQREIEIPK